MKKKILINEYMSWMKNHLVCSRYLEWKSLPLSISQFRKGNTEELSYDYCDKDNDRSVHKAMNIAEEGVFLFCRVRARESSTEEVNTELSEVSQDVRRPLDQKV